MHYSKTSENRRRTIIRAFFFHFISSAQQNIYRIYYTKGVCQRHVGWDMVLRFTRVMYASILKFTIARRVYERYPEYYKLSKKPYTRWKTSRRSLTDVFSVSFTMPDSARPSTVRKNRSMCIVRTLELCVKDIAANGLWTRIKKHTKTVSFCQTATFML